MVNFVLDDGSHLIPYTHVPPMVSGCTLQLICWIVKGAFWNWACRKKIHAAWRCGEKYTTDRTTRQGEETSDLAATVFTPSLPPAQHSSHISLLSQQPMSAGRASWKSGYSANVLCFSRIARVKSRRSMEPLRPGHEMNNKCTDTICDACSQLSW